MSDTEMRVKKVIINRLGVEESVITPEASFRHELCADSLETLELLMEFDKEFNVAINEDEAKKMVNVGDAIRYFEENVK